MMTYDECHLYVADVLYVMGRTYISLCLFVFELGIVMLLVVVSNVVFRLTALVHIGVHSWHDDN